MIFPSCCNNTLMLYSFFKIVKNPLSSMDVSMIGRTTLKPPCTFILICLSLYSLIEILVHQEFVVNVKAQMYENIN